jgi:hypothetical protein
VIIAPGTGIRRHSREMPGMPRLLAGFTKAAVTSGYTL